jgi:hypothetical protein
MASCRQGYKRKEICRDYNSFWKQFKWAKRNICMNGGINEDFRAKKKDLFMNNDEFNV